MSESAARMIGALLLVIRVSCASAGLPPPTGEYPVGMRKFEIVDTTRVAELGGSAHRTLPALVFYPAAQRSAHRGRPYLDSGDAAVEIPSLAHNFHYTLTQLAQLRSVEAHSVLDARPLGAAAKFPVVVFSHGFRLYPLQNTALFEDLASHGYIVITIAHPQDSVALRLQSGAIVGTFEPKEKETSYLPARHEFCCGETFAERTAAAAEFAHQLGSTRLGRSVGLWRDDMLLTARLIDAQGWPAAITDVMQEADVNNIALTGMSFGGDVAAGTCRLVRNCRAAINLDGWPYDAATINSDVGRPFLMVSSDWTRFPVAGQPADPAYNVTDLAFEKWERAGLNPDVVRVRVDGIRHMGLTDLMTLLTGPDKSGQVGDADPVVVMNAVNALCRAFLDIHLKGAPRDRLSAVVASHANLHRRSAEELRDWIVRRQSGPIEISGKTVREDVFPPHPVPFPNGVIALPDVEYSNLAGFRPLLLDLYTPPKAAGPRPLVLVIHGGGWSRGDSRTWGAVADFPATLAKLAARGFVVASINYRLTGEARFPAQIQDVKAALRFLRANAAQYAIDPSRVLAWGGSAGGHLAALAASSCGLAAFAPQSSTGRLANSAAATAKEPDVSDCIQGAVIWFGVFDLSRLPGKNTEALLGCEFSACAADFAAASPISYVSASTVPMLLIHGLDDTQVPAEQSRLMAAHLEQAGVAVETVFIANVDHGFLGKTPAATSQANLQALQRTFDFIEHFFEAK